MQERVCDHRKELTEYQTIGTIKECQGAVKEQQPKEWNDFSETEEVKNCNECVFGIHWGFDKGGMPTIQHCHAKDMSNEESAEMIKSQSECEFYAEGHEFYKRYKNGEFKNISASQKYKIDKKDFSESPVAVCNHINFGRKPCYRGEGQYCYCRLGCTSKTELDGSGRMLIEERDFLIKSIARGIANSYN